jgi:hypothetical protein
LVEFADKIPAETHINEESLLRKCADKDSALLSCRIVTPPFFIRDGEPGIANDLAVAVA